MIHWINKQNKYSVDYHKINVSLGLVAKYLHIHDKNLHLILVGTDKIIALNKQFRKKKYATDVIAFPVDIDYPDEHFLGDLFICVRVAQRQAFHFKHSLEKEIAVLAIHGILHLLGYDHLTDHGEMEMIQERLLNETYTKW
jgi:probable rRNA maturation factor